MTGEKREGSLLNSSLPTDRSLVGFHDVFRMAGDAAIDHSGCSQGHQLTVGRPTAGANPFGGRGGNGHWLAGRLDSAQLLESPTDELRRIRRGAGGKGSLNGVVRGRQPIA